MAKEAKFHLYCNCGEEKSVAATKTFNAQLYLLLWLAAELGDNKDDLIMLKNLKDVIEPVIPQIDALTTKYAEKFKDMKIGKIFTQPIVAPALNNRKVVFACLQNGTFIEFILS